MSQNYFYKPYLSDAESESDSEASTSEDEYVDGGGSVTTTNQLGTVGPLNSVSGFPAAEQKRVPTAPLPPVTDKPSKFETTESRLTTLFMLNSRDRDLRVYPQPTNFTLRLPRPFKNISAINMTQINLLNTFFNFTAAQGNTNMYVQELGRVTSTGASNAINVIIPNGTYTTDTLVPALSNAMNNTPLFAQITLSAFISYFQSSGDYSVLFNTPGPVIYNSLTQIYESNQTVADIVARYFQASQTAGQLSFSYNECVVAYYYPIIKEMTIASPTSFTFSTVGQTLPPGYTTWYDYIVFGFQGLTDPYITNIATNAANQVLFNTYREQNTFVNALVNAYTVSYNTTQGRLVISAPSLNTSIANNLTYQYNTFLSNIILSNGFPDIGTFQTAYAGAVNSNMALISFYNFLQSRFTSNFAVNFGQYSAEFYANPANQITLYNPVNRYGWTTSLTASVSASTINTSVNLAPQYSNWWPNLATISQDNALMGTVSQDQFIKTLTVPQFTGPQGQELVFEGSGENNLGYTDIPFTISSTRYVRIPFTSRCRQNISLLTIPRYSNNRGPATEEVYNLGSTITQTPLLFTYNSTITTNPGTGSTVSSITTYDILDISGNLQFNMYTVRQSMFNSVQFMQNNNQWTQWMTAQILAGTRLADDVPATPPPLGTIGLTNFRPYFFFQIDAAAYLPEPAAHFRIDIHVETQDGSLFPVPITLTWYKDRAAFMSDTLVQLSGNLNYDNTRNYFQQLCAETDVSGSYMTVDVNNDQQTYMSIRVNTTGAIPAGIPLRIFATLTDTYGTYTIATPLDLLDMPYAGLPPLDDQFTPNSAVFQNPTSNVYDSAVTQLAYDVSGVSNNLLDYTIQSGSNYYDPNSVENYSTATYTGIRYQFAYATGGALQPPPTVTDWSLYFGSNSSNKILDTYSLQNNVYLSSLQVPKQAVTSNQYLLTNFAVPYSQPEFCLTPYPDPIIQDYSWYATLSPFQPCSNFPALVTDCTQVIPNPPVISFSNLDVSGVCGVGFFLPPNNIVKLQSFVVKMAYTQPSFFGSYNYTRLNSPLTGSNIFYTGAIMAPQSTRINTATSPLNEWDDWYLYNRRNTKIGFFKTSDISGVSLSSLQLSNALYTMTLSKVTQVNNWQFTTGNPRTRNPDWGTYYTYEPTTAGESLWDVTTTNLIGPSPWYSSLNAADISPTYSAGNSNYPGYTLTPPNINNYTYIPQTYGIAPAVANAYTNPLTLSTYGSDIPNSFTAVPFYRDYTTQQYVVGSFFGITYTQQPALPPSTVTGDAPYFGPAGPYGWVNNTGVFELMGPSSHYTSSSVFYWNAKVEFNVLDQSYDPATDLSSFGGFTGISGEFQDTLLYLYNNGSQSTIDIRDVSTVRSTLTGGIPTGSQTYWSWGQEQQSNYIAADDQSGYNFMSYIHSVPIKTSNLYIPHIRGYDPIPQFTTGLRFIGKNYTDFGSPTLGGIAVEISSIAGYMPILDGTPYLSSPSLYNSTISTNRAILVNSSIGNYFSTEYANALVKFDQTFSTSVTFGKQVGFPGIQDTFLGYGDALSTYVGEYSTITSTYAVYTGILSTATGELNQYVSTNYAGILPPNAIGRSQYTAAIPFQLMFSTYLTAQYASRIDEWGLGWYLGFKKADTYPPRVSVTSDTFIAIVQNYIYLRLNPEFNINSLSVTAKENLSETREATSQEDKYFAKILLNNFGSFSQAAVQLQKTFNPVLGRMETLRCELVDKNGAQLSSIDCEYDMTLNFTEVWQQPKDIASLQTTTADLDVYKEK